MVVHDDRDDYYYNEDLFISFCLFSCLRESINLEKKMMNKFDSTLEYRLAFFTVEKIVSSGTQSVLSTRYFNKRLDVLEARNSGRLIHCRNSSNSFSRVNSKFYKN
jgi:hypothetical protein